MIGFRCDYLEGCHPKILDALVRSNEQQAVGYGLDDYSLEAQNLIKIACGSPHSQVHFLVGGTQTNKTVLAWLLQPWQGVIAPETGHIANHETGAIESSGHKVLTIPEKEGKITAEQVRVRCDAYFEGTHLEHEVAPGAVYISQPTEAGTLYTKAELEAISAVCGEYRISLFVDGARLAYALASPQNDVTLEDLAHMADVFYIGGTKCGALCGEAVVLRQGTHFRNMIKQTGGILAKGRLLGLQFGVLFQEDEQGVTLYETIGKRAVEGALAIAQGFRSQNIPLYMESGTNQQFPILTQNQMEFFEKNFSFEVWEPLENGKTVVRFCTSWASKQEDIQLLLEEISKCPMK